MTKSSFKGVASLSFLRGEASFYLIFEEERLLEQIESITTQQHVGCVSFSLGPNFSGYVEVKISMVSSV